MTEDPPAASRSSTAPAALRAVGAAWRRLVPGDGGHDASPLRLRPRASILILQLQQVGDSLMMSPVVRSIRRRYPLATIDILTTPVGHEVYRRCPYVNRLHVVRAAPPGQPATGRAAAWWAVLRDVRQARYDCAIACRNHVSATYVAAAWATGARHTIGFDDGPSGFLFTRRLRIVPGASVLSTNLALADALDADDRDVREEFWYNEEDRAAVRGLLRRRGVSPAARLAVVHPASNWQSKTWFPDRWAAVADWLAGGPGLTVVFVGRSRDVEVIRAVQERMRTDSHSVAGETDLCQLGALMARADLVVGTDSGPRHIAGAVGCPQVTVMSSLDEPWRWGLDRPSEVVLRTDPACRGCLRSTCSHRLCLDLIPADGVIAACREVLDRALRPSSPAHVVSA